MLVGFGQRCVLARTSHHLADLVLAGVGCPRVAQPRIADHADPDPSGLRELHALHLAAERADLGMETFLRVRLQLLAGLGSAERRLDQIAQVNHRCLRR